MNTRCSSPTRWVYRCPEIVGQRSCSARFPSPQRRPRRGAFWSPDPPRSGEPGQPPDGTPHIVMPFRLASPALEDAGEGQQVGFLPWVSDPRGVRAIQAGSRGQAQRGDLRQDVATVGADDVGQGGMAVSCMYGAVKATPRSWGMSKASKSAGSPVIRQRPGSVDHHCGARLGPTIGAPVWGLRAGWGSKG